MKTITYEQWWTRDAWISDMDLVAEAIWWEQEEIQWLHEQGIEPSSRSQIDSMMAPFDPAQDLFDREALDPDTHTRIYTIAFDVTEQQLTWLGLRFPESQRRWDF